MRTASQSAYRRVAQRAVGGRNTNDYTFVQLLWDDGLGAGGASNLFIHPQYATFAAYSTLGSSFYNGLQFSIRKRLEHGLSFDINYTYSHSVDDASGNEASGGITGVNILNPLRLAENRASSDFDARHIVNANYTFELPFGKGRKFLSNSGRAVDWILGGWQLTGIYRWNTGFPIGQPFDDGRWATNWNVQSNLIALSRLQTRVTDVNGSPNLFANPTTFYQSYRNARPGEAGDRNILREPNFIQMDAGLNKSFHITENQKITVRFEGFNISNTQRLTSVASFRAGLDPSLGTPPSDFGRLTAIQGTPRVFQFAFRYEF